MKSLCFPILLSLLAGCVSAEDDVLATRDAGPSDGGVDTGTTPVDTGTSVCAKKPGAACKEGETRSAKCGNCGTVTDTCDPTTCNWDPGVCKGEGACEAGASESVACTTAGEVKKRTCSATCAWSDFSACDKPSGWSTIAAAPTGFDARAGHGAAWTGKEMVVAFGKGETYKGDAAAYDPAKDTWRKLPAPPIGPRSGPSTIAIGTKVFFFGGVDDKSYLGDGAIYDGATDSWKKIADGPLSARGQAALAWTGTEVLVHGGYPGPGDGAIYDPATDKWRAWKSWPGGARVGHRVVWTGTKAFVWGGSPGGVVCPTDGAVWDPIADTWTALPTTPLEGRFGFVAWPLDGDVLVWGGYGGVDASSLYKSDGARYSLTTGWKKIASPDDASLSPNGRQDALSWIGDGRLYVWSGRAITAPGAVAGGAVFDPKTDKWTAMATKDAPGPRIDSTAVWDGKEAILWGGILLPGVTTGLYANGAMYRP